MGGTRFVGKALVEILLTQGHEVYLFTRGISTLPEGSIHIKGDRKSDDILKLKGQKFDVIIDSSGRKLQDTQSVISVTGFPLSRLIYISSAGVYATNNQLPLDETSPIDLESRHIGKVNTEKWLLQEGIPFTSFRPTYIYGPLNYNPIEKWFFDRIKYSRPIPIPGNGETITQLGHVSDLAEAISLSLQSELAINQIYNCSGKKGVTFKGLALAAAKACSVPSDELTFVSFNPSSLDPKARKAFPLRLSHFLTDISKIESELSWKPFYSLEEGLKDSFINDYQLLNSPEPDFSLDQSLLGI